MQKALRDSYRVPVQDVLEIGGLLKSRILAGADGQNRTITGFSVVEAPDVLDWVRPHTLILTGGFPLKHLGLPGETKSESLIRFISQLDDLNVAGLAIQFGPHLGELPAEVLARADKLGFPIIELPTDVPFDLLLGQMMQEVAGEPAGVVERTEQLHAILEGLLLEGADLQRIADHMVNLLDVGILITSVDGRTMADAIDDDMRQKLTEADLFDGTGRFRTERVRLEQVKVGNGQVVAEPVVAAGNDLARLIAFSPNGEISDEVRIAFQRAANVAALLIAQRQALNAVENKYRGDFLRDVLSGRLRNQERSEEYAVGLGWRLDMPCVVISAQLDPPNADEPPAPTRVRRSWQARFHLAWVQVVGRESKAFPVADFSDEVVAVLAVPSIEDPALALAELHRMVERVVRLVTGDRGGGRRPFSVGTSRLVTSFDQLATAYQQARRATEVGRRVAGDSSVSHFDNLGIHRLIGLIPDKKELTDFARDVLGELADDTATAEELRNTLQVLLDNNLNVAEAARDLIMHYNTVRYRITKLERILGPFTSDPNLRLNVAVALQVSRIGRQ